MRPLHRPGLHYDLLFEALLFPICSPAAAQSGLGLRQPVDLVNHALLQVYTTANDWQLWLDAAGVPHLKGRAAPQFDSYLLAIEAFRTWLRNEGAGDPAMLQAA